MRLAFYNFLPMETYIDELTKINGNQKYNPESDVPLFVGFQRMLGKFLDLMPDVATRKPSINMGDSYILKVGIVTVSDRCYRGEGEDTSGNCLEKIINEGRIFPGVVLMRKTVPDDVPMIKETLEEWSESCGLDLILTTGGTGISPRDVTPEATREAIERELPGMSLAMIKGSLELTPMAMLFRPVCGVRFKTLIVNLPGSEKGSRECLEIVSEAICHAIDLIRNHEANIKATHLSMSAVSKPICKKAAKPCQYEKEDSIITEIASDVSTNSAEFDTGERDSLLTCRTDVPEPCKKKSVSMKGSSVKSTGEDVGDELNSSKKTSKTSSKTSKKEPSKTASVPPSQKSSLKTSPSQKPSQQLSDISEGARSGVSEGARSVTSEDARSGVSEGARSGASEGARSGASEGARSGASEGAKSGASEGAKSGVSEAGRSGKSEGGRSNKSEGAKSGISETSSDVAFRDRKSPYQPVTVEDALNIILDKTPVLEPTKLPFQSTLGSVLTEDIIAPEDLPAVQSSNKDGYAVIAADGDGVRKVMGAVTAGEMAKTKLEPGSVIRITTGAPLPEGADAVVPVEDTELVKASPDGEEEEIKINVKPEVGQDIRDIGSDIKKGDVVLPKNTRIGPAEMGLLAAVGEPEVSVFEKPVIGVLSTGDELVNPDKQPPPGKIRDSNRIMIQSVLENHGFTSQDFGIAGDKPEAVKSLFEKALEKSDVIISSGGVSMGEKDYLKDILKNELGAEIHFGRVLMKPGLPTTFATIGKDGKNKLIFALPGNPVSAMVTCLVFAIPALKKMSGVEDPHHPTMTVKTAAEIKLDARPEYHPATIKQPEEGEDLPKATTMGGAMRSSSLIALRNANALLILPSRTEEKAKIEAGESVSAMIIGDLS